MAVRSGYPRFLPILLWTAFIIYALVSEPSGLPKYRWLDFPGADKLIHAVLFLVEIVAWGWVFRFNLTFKWVLIGLLGCLALGGGLEIIQHKWIDGREGDSLDLLADMIGAIMGSVGSRIIFTITSRFMN
ncbi:VanZ family protein [Bacteroidota bacterium]